MDNEPEGQNRVAAYRKSAQAWADEINAFLGGLSSDVRAELDKNDENPDARLSVEALAASIELGKKLNEAEAALGSEEFRRMFAR